MASYVTVVELQSYTGKIDENTSMQQIYIDSAENIVENYLGFSLSTMTFVPGLIKMTVLRIAALLQTESENNIGVTSKSFDNGGSRTFIKTTDYLPYLEQISPYRIV